MKIDEDEYKADAMLLDKYQAYSAELLRISLLGIALLGFFIDKGVCFGQLFGGEPNRHALDNGDLGRRLQSCGCMLARTSLLLNGRYVLSFTPHSSERLGESRPNRKCCCGRGNTSVCRRKTKIAASDASAQAAAAAATAKATADEAAASAPGDTGGSTNGAECRIGTGSGIFEGTSRETRRDTGGTGRPECTSDSRHVGERPS